MKTALSKNFWLVITIIILVFLAGNFLIYKYGPSNKEEVYQNNPIPNKTEDLTVNWQTYTNTNYGFTMKYPLDLLKTEALQPTIKTLACDYINFENKCPFVPIDGFTGSEEDALKQGSIKNERLTINGRSFCSQETSEGAAGTTYVTYNYTTVSNEGCLHISFSVPYPNCENYLPISNPEIQTAYDKCQEDNKTTKPEDIRQMLTTFSFVK